MPPHGVMRVKIQQTRITPISRLVRSMNLLCFCPRCYSNWKIWNYKRSNFQWESFFFCEWGMFEKINLASKIVMCFLKMKTLSIHLEQRRHYCQHFHKIFSSVELQQKEWLQIKKEKKILYISLERGHKTLQIDVKFHFLR